MSNSNTASSGGIGIIGLLGIIFIVMKLMGWGAVASWSWWLVLLPLWIGPAILLFIWFVWVGFVIIKAILD